MAKRWLGALGAIAGGYLQGRLTAEEHQEELRRQAIAQALQLGQTRSYLETAALQRERTRQLMGGYETPAEQRAAELQNWLREQQYLQGFQAAGRERAETTARSLMTPQLQDIYEPMREVQRAPISAPGLAGEAEGLLAAPVRRQAPVEAAEVPVPDWATTPVGEMAGQLMRAGGTLGFLGETPYATMPSPMEQRAGELGLQTGEARLAQIQQATQQAAELHPDLMRLAKTQADRDEIQAASEGLKFTEEFLTQMTPEEAAYVQALRLLEYGLKFEKFGLLDQLRESPDPYDQQLYRNVMLGITTSMNITSATPEFMQNQQVLQAMRGHTAQSVAQLNLEGRRLTAQAQLGVAGIRAQTEAGRQALIAQGQYPGMRGVAGAAAGPAAATSAHRSALEKNLAAIDKWRKALPDMGVREQAPSKVALARQLAQRDMGPLATNFWKYFITETDWQEGELPVPGWPKGWGGPTGVRPAETAGGAVPLPQPSGQAGQSGYYPAGMNP